METYIHSHKRTPEKIVNNTLRRRETWKRYKRSVKECQLLTKKIQEGEDRRKEIIKESRKFTRTEKQANVRAILKLNDQWAGIKSWQEINMLQN